MVWQRRGSSKNVPLRCWSSRLERTPFRILDKSATHLNRTATMDIEDDDDLYAPEEPTPAPAKSETDEKAQPPTGPANASRKEEELEEGEEEDEGGEIMEEDDDDDSVGPSLV